MGATTKERGLVVDAREAKGLADGSITVLVRVMKDQPREDVCGLDRGGSALVEPYCVPEGPYAGQWSYHGEGDEEGIVSTRRSPFGPPGARLWVQEDGCPWADKATEFAIAREGEKYVYRADYLDGVKSDVVGGDGRWRSAPQMPCWASRTTLVARSVRACRVQDVTEEEARGAGVVVVTDRIVKPQSLPVEYINMSWRDYYAHLVGAAVWDANPYVFVGTVEKIEEA